MHPRVLFAAGFVASVAVLAIIFAFVWQPWGSDDQESGRGRSAADEPRLTLEGVLALVSAEHEGCPDQPAMVLTADVVYDGDGIWTVTYQDYRWELDESDGSVRTVGEPMPCPGR